jgi:hypothetical protein
VFGKGEREVIKARRENGYVAHSSRCLAFEKKGEAK